MSASGTALITGASSGIGAVYADRLARRGHDLILVARKRERLEPLAERLRSQSGKSVGIVVADLNNASDLHRVEAMLKTDGTVTMLVNNAGFGSVDPLLTSDVDRMQDMITLNAVALTRLVYAAAPAFVARGTGTIINISSIAAIYPEILNGVYDATKAFVLVLSQSLHKELAEKGIRIQAVLPGAIATEFWDLAGGSIDRFKEGLVMTPADLVDAALAGLDQGEIVTIPSLPDAGDWMAYDAARRKMLPNLSHTHPAARYRRHV